MPQNYGYPTWPDEYGEGIISRLVDQISGMTRDRVFWSTFDDSFHLSFPPAQDRFITLFQPSFPVIPAAVSGGGIYTTEFDSRLVVKGFLRVEADPEGKAAQWLNDQAFGVLKFAKSIVSTLQTWMGPVEPTSGLSYFTQPMRLSPSFELSKTLSSGNGGARWGLVTTNWSLTFNANLGSPYIGIGIL